MVFLEYLLLLIEIPDVNLYRRLNWIFNFAHKTGIGTNVYISMSVMYVSCRILGRTAPVRCPLDLRCPTSFLLDVEMYTKRYLNKHNILVIRNRLTFSWQFYSAANVWSNACKWSGNSLILMLKPNANELTTSDLYFPYVNVEGDNKCKCRFNNLFGS